MERGRIRVSSYILVPWARSGDVLRPFLKQKGSNFICPGKEAVSRACESPNADTGRRMAYCGVHGYGLWVFGLQFPQSNGSWQMSSSLSPKSRLSEWFTNLYLKRDLATQGPIEDQDGALFGSDSDENSSGSPFLDGFGSDEDLVSENLGPEKLQSQTLGPLNDEDEDLMDDGDEGLADDVETVGEAGDFMAGSLLDVATADLAKKLNNNAGGFWSRIQQATRKKEFSLKSVIDTWVSEGNTISRDAMIFTITAFRRQGKYRRALEVSDWFMTQKPFEFTDMDYAIRVQLVAKVHGLQKATDYFATIPKLFQSAVAYSILLAAYADKNKVRGAERVLLEAEKQGLDNLTFMHNQLLCLYKKNGQMRAFAELLQKMDQKNIEPDIFTYNLILDIRGRKGDISGMEKVWREVENDSNVEPDAASYCILARNYATMGFYEKAEKATKKVEVSSYSKKRAVHQMLLKLYARLGKVDEIDRIWDVITSKSKVVMIDYLIMIQSLGKVGEVERAEEIFDQMILKLGSKNLWQYNALLSVYSKQGLVKKTEDLMKKISKLPFNPGPSTFHELIKMYANAGKFEKAMETFQKLQKTHGQSPRNKPWYASHQVLLEMFAEKGDVPNAEKIMKSIKQSGYICSFVSYRTLLKAYVKSETTPYGFIDRMHADGAIPNSHIRTELKKVNG